MLHHAPAVTGDMLVMEHRLHQLALPAPKTTLAEKKAVAKGGSKDTLEQWRLLKFIRVCHQNLVGQVGVINENVGPVKWALHRDHITITSTLVF